MRDRRHGPPECRVRRRAPARDRMPPAARESAPRARPGESTAIARTLQLRARALEFQVPCFGDQPLPAEAVVAVRRHAAGSPPLLEGPGRGGIAPCPERDLLLARRAGGPHAPVD